MGQQGGDDNIHIIDYVRVYRRCTIEDKPEDCYHAEIKDEFVYHAKNQEIKIDLSAYPNPITNGEKLNVRFKSPEYCKVVDLYVNDLTGKQLLTKKFQDVAADIDIYEAIEINSSFVSGLYLVRAVYQSCSDQNINGSSLVKLLVI